MRIEEFKYSDYCTTFSYDQDGKTKVQFYDEIKERPMKTVTVGSEEEALQLMNEYKANAPRGVVCDILD